MEIHLGYVAAFLFTALPLIVMVVVVAGFFINRTSCKRT